MSLPLSRLLTMGVPFLESGPAHADTFAHPIKAGSPQLCECVSSSFAWMGLCPVRKLSTKESSAVNVLLSTSNFDYLLWFWLVLFLFISAHCVRHLNRDELFGMRTHLSRPSTILCFSFSLFVRGNPLQCVIIPFQINGTCMRRPLSTLLPLEISCSDCLAIKIRC